MKLAFLLLITSLVAFGIPSQAQQPVDPDLDLAIKELQAGNTDKAIAAITESLRKHPDHADAYFLRGNLRMAIDDKAGALSDFNKAIQLKPTMSEAYNQRSLIRLIARDMSGAIQDLDSAIANGLKNDGTYSLRAQLRRQQGDVKGAITDLDESIKLNPNNPQYYGYRGSLLADTDKVRALADLNYLLTWFETEPNTRRENKPTVIDKPSAETDSQKNESGSFKVGLESKTVNPAPGDKDVLPIIASAYYARGLIQSSADKTDAAIADFTKSVRLDSKNVWAYYQRASALERKGDLEAALADINRAIQLEPMNGNLRVEHGVILTIMGNEKEAQVDFDMLLKADPKLWQKRIDDRLEAVKKLVGTKKG